MYSLKVNWVETSRQVLDVRLKKSVSEFQEFFAKVNYCNALLYCDEQIVASCRMRKDLCVLATPGTKELYTYDTGDFFKELISDISLDEFMSHGVHVTSKVS